MKNGNHLAKIAVKTVITVLSNTKNIIVEISHLSVEVVSVFGFLSCCLARSNFVLVHQELQCRPQFIRSGHIVICVAVSERPTS